MNARKPLAAALLALVLLGLSSVTPKAAASTAPKAAAAAVASPCDTAQQALEKGRFPQAETLYTQLSSAQRPAATRACAQQGLIAVDALSAAQQLFAAGLPQQAQDEIVRALNAVPLLGLPASVLPLTGQDGVKLAETLDADGFHQQAQQLLEQVVEADRQIKLDPVARGILGLLVPGFSARVGHAFGRMWDFITSPVPASAGCALVLIVGLNVYYRMRRRLHLQPFAFGGAPLPGAEPDTLRERVWSELQRLSDEQARGPDDGALRLDLAGPYEENLPLGSVSAGFGSFGDIICGLVKPLLRHVHGNSRLVTGQLRPKISLQLDITTVDGIREPGGHTVLSHADLGLPDPDPGEDPVGGRYNQLAMPAAAWIILTRFKDCTLGGTRDWRSFAQFGTGCAWLDVQNLPEAEKYFGDACDTDPRNLAAALNLGALLVQTAVGDGADDQARRRRGYELLQHVAESTHDKTSDLQWYRARYLLPLAVFDFGGPAGDGTQPSEQDRQLAAHYATELASELLERRGNPGDVPVEFTENSLGAALVLAAREHIPTTSDLTQVSTDATEAELAADPGSLITLLRNPAQKGAPEKLARYAQAHCRKTDQMKYNMYRYQQKRVSVCAQAETAVVAALREGTTGQDREQLEVRLRDLEAVRAADLEVMQEFRQGIQDSGDPLLLAAIQDQDGGFDGAEYFWDADGRRPQSTGLSFRADGDTIREPREPSPGEPISPGDDPSASQPRARRRRLAYPRGNGESNNTGRFGGDRKISP